MPKIYEYLGIIFFFYSNEHEPIHIHARKGEYESKAEIYLIVGQIQKIIIKNVKGRKPLKGKDLSHFKIFMEHFAEDVVAKWIDYFVNQKNNKFQKITKKIK